MLFKSALGLSKARAARFRHCESETFLPMMLEQLV